MQYLMKYCLMQSADFLLSRPSESISDIAGECGFDYPSYYAKQFKRLYQCNKGEYRKEKTSRKLKGRGTVSSTAPLSAAQRLYDSTTSRTPAGQAFAQIPQAIHLLLVGEDSAFTITPKGQASTHFPQPVHFFLLII